MMTRSRLSAAVWWVGWVSLLTDLSSEMIYPLLPVFLAGQLGASASVLGLIEGLAEAAASFLKAFSGVWTDRSQRRKPLVVAGYAASALFRPLVGLAPTWSMVLGVRLMDRVGKGIRSSPRDALIADVTPTGLRGSAYGLHRAMDHAGAVAGPLIAAALLLVPGMTERSVFLWAAVPAVIAVAVLVFMVQEPAVARGHTDDLRDSKATQQTRLGWRFKVLMAAVVLFALGNSSDAFLILKLSQSGRSTQEIALLWSALHVVKMVSTYWGGKGVDRWGARASLWFGWIYFAAIYAAFAWVSHPVALVSVFLLYGVYFGWVEPAERAWVVELVPEERRGTALGIYHSLVGLGALPASLLFGAVWENWGASTAFGMGAGFAVAATLLLGVLK